MKKVLLFILLLAVINAGFAQEKFWKFENEQSVLSLKQNSNQLVTPQKYHTLSLLFDQYKSYLNTAPAESVADLKNGLEISLPYPDSSFKKFRIVETKIMDDKLASQFPEIKTFMGQGIDDPASTVRIDYTTQGFHAYVLSPAGAVFIDPYQKGNNNLYITYFSKDYINPAKEKFKCLLDDRLNGNRGNSVSAPLTGACIGTQLRTYRLAISCTGEYAIAVCPAGNVTLANTLSAILTTFNRINGVYQTELDIKMVLVGAETSIIYTNPATDPYTGNDDASTLIDESQSNITAVIGSANFDIGHTFSTGAGGLANVEAACKSGVKAEGVTGLANPTGDAYDIDYVAHEIGHEFGATHPFESETGNCGGGNRVKSSAYEPGSGTTIMAYAGICDSDDIQLHSDPYFHTKSFDQIVAYTTTGTGSTCPVVTATGNHSPVVVMPSSGIIIPKGTPFTLTGTATDIDGDALTYSWEEWDLSNSDRGTPWNSGAYSTVTPLFRVRNPKLTGNRTFPDTAVILAGYPSSPPETMDGLKGETLPQVAREIKFRLVARDNRAGGGGVATGGDGCSATAPFDVLVSPDGPFKFTSPDSSVNWLGGSTHTITWDVANTDSAGGSNVKNVAILMSTDGGNTFPITIVSGTPNTGSVIITMPNVSTSSTVRFIIKAIGNIFFNISPENFTATFNPAIRLLQFSANPTNNVISLNWATSAELNNKGFEVFRSDGDSSHFAQIGFVAGVGNSSTVQNYTYVDNTVTKGVVYFYRLWEVDINNNAVYSEIKSAELTSSGIFSAIIQPQPFYDNANLYLDGINKQDFKLLVTDVLGRAIIKNDIANDQQSRLITIDLNKEPAGIYFIKFLQGNTEKTLKAVKR